MLGDRKEEDSAQRGDPRLRLLLQELELRFRVDEDQNFVLSFEFENGRHQTVVLESETHLIGTFEVRHLYSVGYQCEGELPANVANALLIMNDNVRLGAWKAIRTPTDLLFAAFQAQIAADTTSESLRTALLAVCRTADGVEEKLTGEDLY